MIYILYGLERYLIDKEIKKISVANQIDEFSLSKFSAKTNSIEEILFDIDSMPLFGNKRLIIIDDAYFFTGEKSSDEKILQKIEKFLSNFNSNNIVIFVVNNEKLDERKKITKLIKKIGKCIEFNKKTDITDSIKEMLIDYNITNANINLIKDRLNNKIEVLNSEINKLIIYLDNVKDINECDVLDVISEYPNIDFFQFIDNIINKNVHESLKIYSELLKLKEEPIKIIVTLANQFRLMYQSKKMFQSGYSEKDISLETGEHPYRVKLAISKAQKYSDEILLELLKKLGEINLQAKKGLIDSKTALEMFIIEM